MSNRAIIWLLSCACVLSAACTTYEPIIYTADPLHKASTGSLQLIGGKGNDSVLPGCLRRHPKGGYSLFGQTIKSFGDSTDFLLVRLNEKGKVLWATTYGGTHRDTLAIAISLADGGFVLVGSTLSLFYTPMRVLGPHRPGYQPMAVKVDEEGTPQWIILSVGGTYAVADSKSGFWISGWQKSGNQSESAVVHGILEYFDSSGDIKLQRRISSTDSKERRVLGGPMMRARNGDLLQLLSIPRSAHGHWSDSRPAIARWSKDGGLLSVQRIDGTPSVVVDTLTELPDGGAIAVGPNYDDKGAQQGMVIFRLDSEGRPIWGRHLTAGPTLMVGDVLLAPSGEMLMAGRVGSAGPGAVSVVITLPESGMPVARRVGASNLVEATCLIEASNQDYLLAGTSLNSTEPNLGRLDIFTQAITRSHLESAQSDVLPLSAAEFSMTTSSMELTVQQLDVSKPQYGTGIPIENLEYRRLSPPTPH